MSGMFFNPKAFAPFFDELVSFEAKRQDSNLRLSVKASVMPAARDEVLGEASVDTTRKVWSVSFFKVGPGGWNRSTPPQIGDRVTLKGGAVAEVSKVSEVMDMYELEVREC